jgi:hypothetical protein
MSDKPDGIAVLADFLDDFAKIDFSLIWSLVVLMTAVIWIIAGCYGVFQPDKMLDIRRRWATKRAWGLAEAIGLTSQTGTKVAGYLTLFAGFITLAADVYLFFHPELMP